MANWTKNEPQAQSSQRKKWNLQDRTSLRNLKFQIAEDGCSEVQYDLARQLLEENSEIDPTNSYSQGVHWLMRAADQGHEDALTMLSECYKTRRGITDSNEYEVRACLQMSPGERAARKAARELFACLSNGEEYVTAAQLERKMREIYNIQRKRKRHPSTDSGIFAENDVDDSFASTNRNLSPSDRSYSSHLITEANLLSAAHNYSNGNMPPVNQILTLSVPHPNSLSHIPCFHRLIFHPIVFFLLWYHRFIKLVASFPETAFSNINFIFLVLIYTFFASDNAIKFIPIGLYYVSLTVMVISTFKMLKAKHDFVDFRMWSGLFLSYGERIDAAASENLYLRNNMKPYLFFFVAFFCNLMLSPIITDQWLPHSEITILSFICLFVTMFAFMYSSSGHFPDWIILISFGINVLAKYPYEMDTVVTTGWRFLDLKVPNFPSFLIGNGIEFCLNCRALLYLLIPGVLLMLARRRSWHGTYQYLIPHCVTLSWLQITIISSQCATMFGLVRAALGLAGLLLFLPLFGIVTLMIPVFAAVEWLSLTDPTVRLIASICTAVVAFIGSCIMAANHRTEKYVTILQVGKSLRPEVSVCIIASIFLTIPYMTSDFELIHQSPASTTLYSNLLHQKTTTTASPDDIKSHLDWEQFYQYCQQSATESSNKILTQIRCSNLDGTIIRWEGVVNNIEISRASNVRSELIFNYLPTFVANLIACWFGEPNEFVCDTDTEHCAAMKQFIDSQGQCNLNKWNVYDYEVTVRMQSGGLLSKPTEIVLNAPHTFGNFTRQLNNSDRIWFKGRLKNLLFSRSYPRHCANRPIVDLTAIGCLNCRNHVIEPFQIVDGLKVKGRVKDLYRGVKYLLNVLFNPLVIFK